MLAPATDAPAAPKLHDVTIVIKKTYQCARVEGVPPEEFGISRNAKNIKDSGYCFHETPRRQSDLIAEGFDAEQIKKLPSYTLSQNIETVSRDTVDETTGLQGDEGMNNANRLIKITEHYVRMDYERDGKTRLYRVTTGGESSEVLKRDGKDDIVEVDSPPFAAMTPVIMTHRFFGRSVADLVMDIQRIKTALLRGMLDNLYLHNNPRVVVAETGANENTLDDLLLSRPGGIVRAKTNDAVEWQVVPDITGSVYPAMQYMDATREWRTGVSRQGQGTDPNALQNQVATIANQMFNAAQAKTRLIARIFAETGIRDLFILLHSIIRKNGSQADTVRLRNKWVNVDPREWKSRDDMTVKVGLGDGSKAEQLSGHQLLIAAQEKAVAVGLVSKKNLFNSAKHLTKLLNHKDPNEFFTLPETPDADQAIQPPPDPEMAKMEKQAEIEKIQAQADIATTQAKVQSDAALKEREFQHKAALDQQAFELERELKLMDAQIKRDNHQQDMAAKVDMHRIGMQQAQEKHAMGMQHMQEKAALKPEKKSGD